MVHLSLVNLLAVCAEVEKYLTEFISKGIPVTTWFFADVVAMIINPPEGISGANRFQPIRFWASLYPVHYLEDFLRLLAGFGLAGDSAFACSSRDVRCSIWPAIGPASKSWLTV